MLGCWDCGKASRKDAKAQREGGRAKVQVEARLEAKVEVGIIMHILT